MHTKKIPITEKVSCTVHSSLEYSDNLAKKKDFISVVSKDVERLNEDESFGGCYDREAFVEQLNKSMFADNQIISKITISNDELIQIISDAISKIKHLIRKNLTIFVFPTNSEDTIKNLKGVYGELIWDDIIHIYIHPTNDWKLQLQSTLLHEYAHNLQPYCTYEMTLFEHLVAEGLAERFQEYFLNGNVNEFTQVLSETQIREILHEIRTDLDKTMEEYPELHSGLFFGNSKYKSGTGYSIGYHIVKNLVKSVDDWNQVLSKSPNRSMFLVDNDVFR